ncbi:carbohydrate ABC transporter permease [Granulosicoccus antarcticus]|uniref:L-arabinose transport system permease protein AraQ n=1 Tax=Granulosicoccus antarcticus IMCC3135 TaxID=1192854 RepID=A0A2Z2NZY7_9GAMM|nr:carbohydrate ABC transporter permease [Granulosicoccus antarcticus]ASJ72694.1 L-arabinose transport system permease protein AraQ [Granulosicoccus antarcticus IMCC3135]
MGKAIAFLTRTRGSRDHAGSRLHWTDWFTYGYLLLGIVLMFGPVIWLLMSSFKTDAELNTFPPRFLPYAQEMITLDGHTKPLPIFTVTEGELEGVQVAQVRRVGIVSQVVKMDAPDEIIKIKVKEREPVEKLALAWENYSDLFKRFNFMQFLWNSTFITVISTLIMLLVNSMAAFALSKYEFRGRTVVLAMIIGTLMIPQTVVLVPLFLVVREMGMINSLWGVIIPGAATPTGVFLLRQYMLTIPDEILDAARMDKASEWKIYWRIILPLSAPAIAVLAILAIMWRWNDFLWPLIVLSRTENFTLQLALNSFQGEMATQWSSLLAMTVLTLLPIAVVFAFLQKYIATGIASTGGK